MQIYTRYQQYLNDRYQAGIKCKARNVTLPAIILVQQGNSVVVFNAVARTKDEVKCFIMDACEFIEDFLIDKDQDVVVI